MVKSILQNRLASLDAKYKRKAEDLRYAQHYKPSDKANHTNQEICVG